MKTVELKDSKYIVKFTGDDFTACLTIVQNLKERSFDRSNKCWIVLPIKENREILKNSGFEFLSDISYENVNSNISIYNNKIAIQSSIDILHDLSNQLSCDDYSYCWVKGRFDSSKITTRRFLNIEGSIGYAPIGFLEEVKEYFEENCEIKDYRVHTNFVFTDKEIKDNLHYLELYDYQVDSVKICLTKKNGIIKLPTSSGKTEIFLSLCNLMKIKTLILFSRVTLARQTLARAKKAGLDVGIVQGSVVDEEHSIVIATIQSANKLSGKYDMVIVDEVHQARADLYQKVLAVSNFLYRFGFSATPFIDGDENNYKNMRVKQWIGDIVFELSADVLIDSGKIAKPTIYITKIYEPDYCTHLTWPDIEKKGIINNISRNQKIIDLCIKHKKGILILVKRIDHGKQLESLIENSIFLYGDSDVSDREVYVEKFENGEDIVLIASTIFDEGISINSIRHLIIASGGKSQIKSIQRIGRGLRIKENKKTVSIYDFYDNINHILERHSEGRIKAYKKEGFTNIIYE